MKKRTLALAALAPLMAITGANAAMDEMEAPEMRVWSAVLSEPGEEAPGAELQIVATRSPGGNRLVVESVGIVSTAVSKDDEGNMTETMSSLVCAGPFMLEGRRSFVVEAAAPMEEDAEMKKDEAGMAEAEGCAFSVSGKVKHTYRAWHSWDISGSVTVGETSLDFDIADKTPAMVLEPEAEPEGSEAAEGSG